MITVTLDEIAKATGGRLIAGDADREVRGVNTDTRAIGVGELFVPLSGERYDGHEFVGRAIDRGALGFLTEADRSSGLDRGHKLGVIEVRDTLAALGQIAALVRAKSSAQVVGVTGSTGKTSTKDILSSVISPSKATVASANNYNNEVGVPLTLLSMEPETEVAIVEMGMRGRGEIALLAGYAQPNIGIITNIGLAHVELLSSQKGIAEAKSELAIALPENGHLLLHEDDPWTGFIAERTRASVTTFGLNSEADFSAEDLSFDDGACATWRIIARGTQGPRVTLKIPGLHNVLNALAAAAAASLLQISLDEIATRLEEATLSGMRLNVIRTARGVTVIDDTYNANPTSMAGALDTLVQMKPDARHIAVLGQMAELGSVSIAEHERLGEKAARLPLDMLVGVGDGADVLIDSAFSAGLSEQTAKHFDSNGSALRWLRSNVNSGDVVLVKGSRVAGLEEVVAGLAEES